MSARWPSALSAIILLLLLGCGPGSKVAGPCSSGFAVQFRIASVRDSLPLDSLSVDIAVGGGDPQQFSVNLKTGVSSAAISAAQGQAYKLTFKLFSSAKEIGSGVSEGTLECDLDVALDPKWDTAKVGEVKRDLGQGALLPSKLADNFTQAVAGKVFELPLDSLSGSVYRWYLKLGGATLIEDEGPVVRILIADSLAGKELVLRLQVVSNGVIKEDRTWAITVLAALPQDRVARIKTRSDTTSKLGTSLAFRYADGRVERIELFASLVPEEGEKPVGVESLFYDDKGRLKQSVLWSPDGDRTDSLFLYDDAGRLAALETGGSGPTVLDSLFYAEGRFSGSRRYVDGTLTESSRSKWIGDDRREDSLFTMDDKGPIWSRLIQNVYKHDSLISRRVLAVRDGLQPLGKEVIAYNALGGRAYREVYSEEATFILEMRESYGYDAKGRLISLRNKDEVTGALLYALDYEYGPVSAKNGLPLTKSARTGTSSALAVLADLHVSHSDWNLRSPLRHRISGR